MRKLWQLSSSWTAYGILSLMIYRDIHSMLSQISICLTNVIAQRYWNWRLSLLVSINSRNLSWECRISCLCQVLGLPIASCWLGLTSMKRKWNHQPALTEKKLGRRCYVKVYWGHLKYTLGINVAEVHVGWIWLHSQINCECKTRPELGYTPKYCPKYINHLRLSLVSHVCKYCCHQTPFLEALFSW